MVSERVFLSRVWEDLIKKKTPVNIPYVSAHHELLFPLQRLRMYNTVMKTMRFFLVVLFFILLFTSCTTTTKRFEIVSVGMTKEEILKICGKPSSTGYSSGRTTFTYNEIHVEGTDVYIDYQIIFDENDKVIEFGQINSYSPGVLLFYI